MYPRDAISLQVDQSGATTSRMLVSTTTDGLTVLDIATIQSNVASDTYIRCNAQQIFHNFAREISATPTHFICYGSLYMDKTGSDDVSLTLTYVPRDRSIWPDPDQNLLATSTTKTAEFGMSLLLVVVVLLCVDLLRRFFYTK